MAIGDITWQTLKIGQLDLLSSEAGFHGIDIYEDINDPFGSPLCEINVVDPIDALNKYKITGSYDENPIELKFKYTETGEIVAFKFRMQSNKNQRDNAANKQQGTLKSKEYKILGIQEEWYKSQRGVEKHFPMAPSTTHVEKIFKEVIKTEKPFETKDSSEPRENTFGRHENPINVTQKLLQQHTSKKYKSSAYAIFQEWKNGNPKIVQTTYEQLFEQSPVATLRENTTLNAEGSTQQDWQNSILWAEYDSSWSEIRPISKAKLHTFNRATHTVVDQNYRGDTPSDTPAYRQPASYNDYYYVSNPEDDFNNGQQNTNSEARRRRTQYISHLSQGTAKIEIPGNPKITLGSVIELDIQKKTDNNEFGGEGQFNKKALVVAIRHKIKPAGQSPTYTMVLELVKAGMEKGGTTA